MAQHRHLQPGQGRRSGRGPGNHHEVLSYFAGNLIWQFSDRAWAGVEYLYGSREDVDDARGEAHRVQFALRFDI